MNKGIIVDPLKCNGCHSCEVACSTWRAGELNPAKSRIRMVPFLTPGEAFFYPSVCHQCHVPYCAIACPTRALWKDDETGIVELTEDLCIGCRMCMVACPFGAISFNFSSIAVKCDLCGGDPICVKFCRPQAIAFAMPDDLSAARRQGQAQLVRQAQVAAESGTG